MEEEKIEQPFRLVWVICTALLRGKTLEGRMDQGEKVVAGCNGGDCIALIEGEVALRADAYQVAGGLLGACGESIAHAAQQALATDADGNTVAAWAAEATEELARADVSAAWSRRLVTLMREDRIPTPWLP